MITEPKQTCKDISPPEYEDISHPSEVKCSVQRASLVQLKPGDCNSEERYVSKALAVLRVYRWQERREVEKWINVYAFCKTRCYAYTN